MNVSHAGPQILGKPRAAVSADRPAGPAKTPTGIQGLDPITGGGLPAGRPTLAVEFPARGATRLDEPGVFRISRGMPLSNQVCEFTMSDIGVEMLDVAVAAVAPAAEGRPVSTGESADDAHSPCYVLRLCVAGSTPCSAIAIANVRKLCDEHLKGRYGSPSAD